MQMTFLTNTSCWITCIRSWQGCWDNDVLKIQQSNPVENKEYYVLLMEEVLGGGQWWQPDWVCSEGLESNSMCGIESIQDGGDVEELLTQCYYWVSVTCIVCGTESRSFVEGEDWEDKKIGVSSKPESRKYVEKGKKYNIWWQRWLGLSRWVFLAVESFSHILF